MCPRNYHLTVDTKSWGMCSCWENGNYRSKNGKSETCLPVLPMAPDAATTADDESVCTPPNLIAPNGSNSYIDATTVKWCQQNVRSSKGQICPTVFAKDPNPTDDKLEVLCAEEASGTAGDTIDAVEYQNLHNQ